MSNYIKNTQKTKTQKTKTQKTQKHKKVHININYKIFKYSPQFL